MVDAMLEQDATADDIQLWITSFSQQYDETMQYNESGLYGVIRGQGVYSSGWQPEPQYNIFERPWYLQAVAANGECARSMVYEDARTGTRMVSLSKLLSDGESVLALDIRAGDIQVEWQEGSDVFPGTATIVDQAGNVLLHQQIGQEHISCELDDFDNQDYLDMMAQFEGTKGFIRWDGELDSYQNYYIVGQDGWTCIVTIPRSVITADATTIFYFQLLLEGAFLLVILYLFIRNYLSERRGRQTLNCFEALAGLISAWLWWMPAASAARSPSCLTRNPVNGRTSAPTGSCWTLSRKACTGNPTGPVSRNSSLCRSCCVSTTENWTGVIWNTRAVSLMVPAGSAPRPSPSRVMMRGTR